MKIIVEFDTEEQVRSLIEYLEKERLMNIAGLKLDSAYRVDEPYDSPKQRLIRSNDQWIEKLYLGVRRERRLINGQLVFEWFDLRKKA